MNRRWLAPLTPLYAAGLALRNRRIESGAEPVRRLAWPVIGIGQPLHRRSRQDAADHCPGQSPHPARPPCRCSLPRLRTPEQAARPRRSRRNRGAIRRRANIDSAGSRRCRFMWPRSASTRACWPRPTIPLFRSPKVHLLDDGFQHRQLHRDVNILLIDRQDWQDRLLPVGNLREPLQAARRATVLAIPANEREFEAVLRAWGWQGLIWRLKRTMEISPVDGPVVAFCGIARPEQFFAGFEAAGLRLAARLPSPTTAAIPPPIWSGWRRLPGRWGPPPFSPRKKTASGWAILLWPFPESLPLLTATLRVEIENEAEAVGWLMSRLKLAPVPPPL